MGPSRAVTLTLPDYVLDALSAIDPDLSRAVVRLTQPELAKQPHPPAELVRFGQSAVIVVNPTRTLEQRTGVNLIPLPGLDGYGIVEPSLSYRTRRSLEQFKPFGMLILVALLFAPAINQVFFDAVYALFELSGVPSNWSRYGSYLTRFWT